MKGPAGLGAEPLGEGRAGQGGVRAGQQAAVVVERVVRVGRVADRLDRDRVAALGREELGQVWEVFLAWAGDLVRPLAFWLAGQGQVG